LRIGGSFFLKDTRFVQANKGAARVPAEMAS
jgi:hypothetical protein